MELELDDRMTRVFGTNNSTVKTAYQVVHNLLLNGKITFEKDYFPFICNHDVAVKYDTRHTVCFCSPDFYGSQCEYYSDRIIVVPHLDLVNYRPLSHEIAVRKVWATFLFKDPIIDYCKYYVDPQTQIVNNYIK